MQQTRYRAERSASEYAVFFVLFFCFGLLSATQPMPYLTTDLAYYTRPETMFPLVALGFQLFILLGLPIALLTYRQRPLLACAILAAAIGYGLSGHMAMPFP